MSLIGPLRRIWPMRPSRWSPAARRARRPPRPSRSRLTVLSIGALAVVLAIVGDVGIQSKLGYTAHGDGVNMATRLQACNKKLGSAICVGPVAAARCDGALLQSCSNPRMLCLHCVCGLIDAV
jgi:class 3 adenylate cyclase